MDLTFPCAYQNIQNIDYIGSNVQYQPMPEIVVIHVIEDKNYHS